jgi:hypothetical protein
VAGQCGSLLSNNKRFYQEREFPYLAKCERKSLVVALAVPALLAGTVVSTASSSAGAAETVVEDEQWPQPNDGRYGLHGIILEDSAQTSGGGNSISSMSTTSPSAGELLCTSLSSAPCANASNYYYQAMLAPCSASITIDCIEGITSISSTQEAVAGTYKEMFPKKGANEFDGSVEKVSRWAAPQAFGLSPVHLTPLGRTMS